MTFSKKWFLAAILIAAAVFVAAAAADHGGGGHEHGSHEHGKLLRANLVGSILSDPPIHGLTRGGVPWQGKGTASLDRRGRFEFRIRNLVIAGTGNAGPVTSIRVSLFCAPETSPAVFTTNSTPLSPNGNARLRQHVTVPARCLAPVLLVHPNASTTAYIAASGFTH
jgi:hypothetical protein